MKKDFGFSDDSVIDFKAALTIVLGTNGTGKTIYLENMATSELKKKNRRVLVVVPDVLEWSTLELVQPEWIDRYTGARKIIYFDGLLDVIIERFKNGLLIFEDCRAYLTNRPNSKMHSLLIRHRQNMVSIAIVGRGFLEVPPKMFTFATDYVLFKTIDNPSSRKDVICKLPEIKAARNRVNINAMKEPHYYEIF